MHKPDGVQVQVVVKPGIVLKPKRADRRIKTTPEFFLDNLRFHADAIIRSVIKQKEENNNLTTEHISNSMIETTLSGEILVTESLHKAESKYKNY